MPEDKEKYDPKKLYQTPEFPEDQGTQVIYDEPSGKSKLPLYLAIAAATVVLVAAVLVLSGTIQIPGINGPAGTPMSGAPPAGMPAVTELMSGNKSAFAASDGKYYDWIELYNPTSAPVDLAGYYLSDDPKTPKLYALPSYTLQSRAFLVVLAAGRKSAASGNEIYAPFKLKTSGSLLFSAPDGSLIQRIDYKKLKDNESWAVDMESLSKWSDTKIPTPGGVNFIK